MIIQNPNTREIVNILVIGMFFYGGIIMLLIILMKNLFDYIRDIEIQVKQMTPESRALAHAYYKRLVDEQKRSRRYDEILDKMFEDEK